MAVRFENSGGTQSLQWSITAPYLLSEGMSMFAWIKIDTAAVDAYFNLETSSGFGYRISTGNSGSSPRFSCLFGGLGAQIDTNLLSLGTWYAVLMTTNSSSNDHHVYVNGVEYTDTTTITVISSPNLVTIGKAGNGGGVPIDDGSLAEPAMWDTQLTDDEYNDGLAKGVSPRKIRPEHLFFHPTLLDPETDSGGYDQLMGVAPSSEGSPTKVAHPDSIIYPRRPQLVTSESAAGGLDPRVAAYHYNHSLAG